MSSVNKVILVGNLGQDPEVNQLPNGGSVANFSIATTERWKDKQTGERKELTEWHRLVAYQRLAEIVGEYLKKGAKVYIEGRLQTRKWQGQDGVERYTTEIVVNELQMLDSRGGQQGGGQGNQPQQQQNAQQQQAQQQQAPQPAPQQQQAQQQQAPQQNAPQPAPQQTGDFQDFDDDIPF